MGAETDSGSPFISGVTEKMDPPFNDIWTVPGEEAESRSVESRRSLAPLGCDDSLPRRCSWRSFLSAVSEDREPQVDGEAGRRVVELFTAVYRSQREHAPLASLPLSRLDVREAVKHDGTSSGGASLDQELLLDVLQEDARAAIVRAQSSRTVSQRKASGICPLVCGRRGGCGGGVCASRTWRTWFSARIAAMVTLWRKECRLESCSPNSGARRLEVPEDAAAACTCTRLSMDLWAPTESSALRFHWRLVALSAPSCGRKAKLWSAFFGDGAVNSGSFHEAVNLRLGVGLAGRVRMRKQSCMRPKWPFSAPPRIPASPAARQPTEC